jgi:hypothetical protein
MAQAVTEFGEIAFEIRQVDHGAPLFLPSTVSARPLEVAERGV